MAITFVLVGEILIWVPSIARFRLGYLQERLAAAHLATVSVEISRGLPLPLEIEDRILAHAGATAITLWNDGGQLMLGRIRPVDMVYDLRDPSVPELVRDSFMTALFGRARSLRVIGPSPINREILVDIILDEAPLRQAMLDYSWRILALSIFLSVLVAGLLCLSLDRMIVRPLRAITLRVDAFRRTPEDVRLDPPPADRADEIGVVQRELIRMQEGLRESLLEKTRLAALGEAVGRLTHELRNILSTAVLLSDRLEASSDPKVREVTPKLIDSLDRAVRICADTLRFARDRPPSPEPSRVMLRALLDEVAEAALEPSTEITFTNEIPPRLEIVADRDQIYRMMLNIVRNAREAIGNNHGSIMARARRSSERAEIEIIDTGPGIAPNVLPKLFATFSGSTKRDGSGLGLAICREIARAHGGDVSLGSTGPEGTVFVISLPLRDGG